MARFPFMPMLAIMVSLVSYEIVCMSVFAYVGFMMKYLGVVDDTDKAGYYAGLLSSAFMIGRLLSSHFWGLVADRYGCRLVFIVGLVSTAVLSVGFGTSKTFAWAFTYRFLLGLLNGMVAASKTLVADVCGKEHETVGMGVVTTSWSIGTLLGPGFGGLLAEPADHYPHIFSQDGIFGRNPYLLPNVIGAGLALVSLPLVLIFLRDDHTSASIFHTVKAWCPSSVKAWCPSSVKAWCSSWSDLDDTNDDDGIHDGCEANRSPPATMVASGLPPHKTLSPTRPPWMHTESTHTADVRKGPEQVAENLWCDVEPVKLPSLLAQQHIRILLVIEGLFSFVYTGFDEIYTLWALSTVARGGLGWSSVQIGQVFLACGSMVLFFEIFAVPYITPRLGVKLVQRSGSVFEAPVYVLLPMLSMLDEDGTVVTLASMILVFTCYVSSNFFYIGVSLAFNNATGPERRGELNGIAAGVSALGRAVAPIFCATLFAFSIDGDRPFPFDYHCAFYVIAVLRLTVACLGWNRINNDVVVEKVDTGPMGLNRTDDTGVVEVSDLERHDAVVLEVPDDAGRLETTSAPAFSE